MKKINIFALVFLNIFLTTVLTANASVNGNIGDLFKNLSSDTDGYDYNTGTSTTRGYRIDGRNVITDFGNKGASFGDNVDVSGNANISGSLFWSDSVLSSAQGGSIELGSSGTPYIDFANDNSSDYDARIILDTDDELQVNFKSGTNGTFRVNGLISQIGLGDSTYIGYEAGINDDLTSNVNTGIGYRALKSNTSGVENTGIGYYALPNNTKGNKNTSIGNLTLRDNTTGNSNTALGWSAMTFNDSGSNNTVIGHDALNANIVGSDNTAIGTLALHTTLGGGNVALGNGAGYNELGSNKLYIDNSSTATPLIYGDFSTDELTINGDATVSRGLTVNGEAVIRNSTTNSVLTIVPDEINSNDDSTLFLGEDDNASYGMGMKYDGGVNKMIFYGKVNSIIHDDLFTITRNTGDVTVLGGVKTTCIGNCF